MNTRTPSLRKHVSGQYMVTWGGQDHYLGHDKRLARQGYLEQLRQWAEWRQERQLQSPLRLNQNIVVDDLVEQFLEAKERERGVRPGPGEDRPAGHYAASLSVLSLRAPLAGALPARLVPPRFLLRSLPSSDRPRAWASAAFRRNCSRTSRRHRCPH